MLPGPPQSTMQTRLQKVYVPCLVIMVLALGLQAAGFGTKGWMIMRYPVNWLGISVFSGQMEIKVGLWEIDYCIDSKCQSVDVGKMGELTKHAIRSTMEEYQIETSIALATLLIAMVALASTRCVSCQQGRLQQATIVMFLAALLSGILALVASGKFGNDQKKAHDLFKLVSFKSPFLFPYSLILTGIGGILAIISSIVILFGIRPWQNDLENPPAYELSGEAQQNALLAGSYPPVAQQAPYNVQPSPYSAQSGGYVVSPGQPTVYSQPYDKKY